MYDQCESCGKLISSAEDCKLFLDNSGDIRVYCVECSNRHMIRK